jgi:hypothetical protein
MTIASDRLQLIREQVQHHLDKEAAGAAHTGAAAAS